MKLALKTKSYRVDNGKKFRLKDHPTKLKKAPYLDDLHYETLISAYREEIDDLQNQLYAHNRWSVLMVFQAMDAAGKDSTIRHVLSGINPQCVHVTAFKRPSEDELDHDFLWRTTKALPERGRVGVFNRSYYEEVLVCRVHPSIVTQGQRLPEALAHDSKDFWAQRYRSIRQLERHLTENGTVVLKFFLNVSKAEQKRRFLERIETPAKNWKFAAADVKERKYWNAYMDAYEKAIQETATEGAPWHVIPADDKKAMRLIVSAILLDRLRSLKLTWPKLSEAELAELAGCKEALLAE